MSWLERQPWMLKAGVDVPQDVPIAWPNAMFEDGTLSGSTGCNRYTASYTLDGESLALGPIAATRMACPPPADAIERAYLAALEQVTGWHVDGQELVLVDEDGAERLRYAPAAHRTADG